MRDNTESVIDLLRDTADALERGEAEYSDYRLRHHIPTHAAKETDIEVEIIGMDFDEVSRR